MKKTRILIVDDHEIVRRGLRPLIESEWGWEICGEAKNGREAVELAAKQKPDIVVLDIGMPELNGIEVTREIRRILPGTEVLAFTGTENETLVHQIFAAGAKALCEHQPYLGSRISRIVFESYLQGGVAAAEVAPGGLTVREREVVQLLAEGKSNKDVATALAISVKTVETHRATIMRKLGFTAFADLVRYAVRNQIVQP